MLDNTMLESEKSYRWAFFFCACCAMVPLWSIKYPPMVDLPQHAAQVFMWKHFDNPAYDFKETYYLKYSSPYFVGYVLARFFAVFLPIHAAMKAAISLVFLALPLTMDRLLKTAGADRWWALLGFPLAYSFAFHWGFFNFIVAVPAGVAFVWASWLYARGPTRRSGLVVSLLALILYYCHALVFGVCIAAVGLLLLASIAGGLKEKVIGVLPLVPPVAAIGVWVLTLRSTDESTGTQTLWSENTWQRVLDMPSILLGGGQVKDGWWIGGFILFLLPFVFGTLRRRPGWLWLPALVATVIFFAMPNRTLGTWFVYQRLAVFIPIFLLVAVAPAASAARRRWGRATLIAFVVGWMAFLTVQFQPIGEEGRQFDELLDRMEPNKKVLGLVFDPGTGYATGLPVFGHFFSWYQAQKGGRSEFSFAIAFPQLVQYREGRGPIANPQLSLHPDRFNWQRDGLFDYFLVRGDGNPGAFLFREADAPVVLEGRAGDWWLFQRLE